MYSNTGWCVGEEMESEQSQCFACLSADRKLSPLGDNILVFSQLFDTQSLPDVKVLLCWECSAQLKKTRLFKEKVENAQQQLCFWLKDQQQCLSNLIVSTEVWTIGEAPQEIIKTPSDLQPCTDLVANTPKSKYPETWVEDGITIPDIRQSKRIKDIVEKNPNQHVNKKIKKKVIKKKQEPVSLPLSFRQARKCKQVIPVKPSHKTNNDNKVEMEIKSEVLENEHDNGDDNFANYDEDDFKNQIENDKLLKGVKPVPEKDHNSVEDNFSDPGIIGEDDFEWSEKEDETINKPESEDEKFVFSNKTDNIKVVSKQKELEEDPDVVFNLSKKAKRDNNARLTIDGQNKKDEKHEDIDNEDLPYTKVFRAHKIAIKLVSVTADEMVDLLENDRNSEIFLKVKGSSGHACEKCVKPLQRGNILQHKKDHTETPEKNHKCHVCELLFSSEQSKSVHIHTTHTSALQCSACAYKCTLLEVMCKHLWGHRQYDLQCNYCGGQYEGSGEFYKHFCICDTCDKPFKSRSMLIKHMQSQHLPYKCKICNKTLRLFKYYKNHQIKHVSPGAEPKEDSYCVVCDKQFNNRLLYLRHVESNVHSFERTYKTEEKSKEPKVYQCKECPKSYSNKHILKDHCDFYHNNKFKYQCKLCDKKYFRKGGLQLHIQTIHKGVRPEKNKFCSFCGRGFSQERILVNHIRTHTGERPFQCEHCDAAFAQKSAMWTHVKHIHRNVKRNA